MDEALGSRDFCNALERSRLALWASVNTAESRYRRELQPSGSSYVDKAGLPRSRIRQIGTVSPPSDTESQLRSLPVLQFDVSGATIVDPNDRDSRGREANQPSK